MIDNVMVNIGAAFMIVGGAVLVSVVLGVAIYAVALVWVSAINKLRRRAKLVTRCKDCKHLCVWNRKDIYAFCSKTNIAFLPFELDTRTFFCSYGERKDGGNADENRDPEN